MKTNNQFKPDLIDRLQGEIYDKLTLERERLTQLSKLIDTVIHDLDRYPTQPAHCIEQAGITLGIIQYLLLDFSDSVRYEIGQLEEGEV